MDEQKQTTPGEKWREHRRAVKRARELAYWKREAEHAAKFNRVLALEEAQAHIKELEGLGRNG